MNTVAGLGCLVAATAALVPNNELRNKRNFFSSQNAREPELPFH